MNPEQVPEGTTIRLTFVTYCLRACLPGKWIVREWMLSQIFCAVTIFHQFQLYFLPFSPYSFSNPFQSFFSVRKKRGTDRRRCVDASKNFFSFHSGCMVTFQLVCLSLWRYLGSGSNFIFSWRKFCIWPFHFWWDWKAVGSLTYISPSARSSTLPW